MKRSVQYLKVVEWSKEDQCYVGRCPELMLGGVHGENEQTVFAELCAVIEEWIDIAEKDNEPLPPGMAGKRYSGKFNLRLEKALHERLAIEATRDGKSLNAYCIEALERQLGSSS
jgi:predicted RNase H-like HicB family nuclease